MDGYIDNNINGKVVEKNGLYYTVMYIYTVKDGARVRKPIWKSTGLKANRANKKTAVELLKERCYKCENGCTEADSNIAMKEYVEKFLASKRRELADTTYSGYMNKSKYIISYFEKVRVKDVTTSMLNEFYDYLLTNGKIKKGSDTECGLSVRTVKDVKALVDTLFAQAKEDSIVYVNPALKSSLNKVTIRKAGNHVEGGFFDYDECMRFLNLCKDHELYELFYFTIFFGLRRSEVLGMRWGNIDFNKKQLTISSTVTKGTRVNREESTKTESSYRTYPLSERQCEILNNLKLRQIKNKQLFGKMYFDNDYVFKHEDGKLFYPDYPTKAFQKIVRKDLSLPQNVHFHSLRASCVSILVHEKADISKIQKYVGHADISTTLKYYTKVKAIESNKEMLGIMSDKLRI